MFYRRKGRFGVFLGGLGLLLLPLFLLSTGSEGPARVDVASVTLEDLLNSEDPFHKIVRDVTIRGLAKYAAEVGDFEYGPYVLVGGRSVQSYLSAFIDVCSRYIVAARYYVRQNFCVLSDTLIRGLEIHGAPLRAYVDNGKVYHAHALKQACYRIGIGLLHRAKGDPATGGIIERFLCSRPRPPSFPAQETPGLG